MQPQYPQSTSGAPAGYQVTSQVDGNAMLMGGEKTKAFSFDGPPPIMYAGEVVSELVPVQSRNYDTDELEFWPDGKPKLQLVVKIQTDLQESDDDTGVRSLWLKGESQKAVANACRLARRQGLEVGGYLTIEYYAAQENPPEPGKKKRFPTKLYRATYTPPQGAGNQALMGTQPEYDSAPAPTPASGIRQAAAQQSAVMERFRNGPTNHQGARQAVDAPF